MNSLLDTNKALQAFFDGCAAAGPDGCPFYAPTADAISKNLTNLYTSIRNKPVPYAANGVYGFVDYGHVRAAVFSSLESPFLFPILARGLADLAAGDGALIFTLTRSPTDFECSCGEHGNDVYPDVDRYARATIGCNDGDPVPDSLEEYRTYFAQLYNTSSFAEIWGVLRAQCM